MVLAHKIFAVINAGSRSLKCEFRDQQGQQVRPNLFETLELGRDLRLTGKLNAEAIEPALNLIGDWLEQCRSMNIDPRHIRIVATAAVREAQDSQEFKARFAARNFEIPLTELSQWDEARLGLKGMLASHPHFKEGLFWEQGGASGQLGLVQNRETRNFIYFKFGVQDLKAILKKELPRGFAYALGVLKREISRDPGMKTLLASSSLRHQPELVLTGGIFWKFAYYHLKVFRNSPLDFFTLHHQTYPHLSPLNLDRDFKQFWIPFLHHVAGIEFLEKLFEKDPSFPDAHSAVIALSILSLINQSLNPLKISVARGAVDDGIFQELLQQKNH